MNIHLKILTSGLVISFLGSIPIGTLNTTAFQIAAAQNVGQALLFAFAVILVELIVVRLTLAGAGKINFGSKLFSYLLPPAIALLVFLAISNFISAGSAEIPGMNSQSFPMIKSSFLLGLALSILNPMHFPFWMGWNSILIAKKSLDNRPGMYSSYIAGIGLGSFAGILIFIILGRIIFRSYHQYTFLIAVSMGILYLFFAIYLLFKFLNQNLKPAFK